MELEHGHQGIDESGELMTISPKAGRVTLAEERRAYRDVAERDQRRCVKCRLGPDVQRDHRKNRSQGGGTVLSNLQLLCARCHQWKTEHPLDALEQGFAVPGWATPAEWPARRWIDVGFAVYRRAWVLYDDLGRWVEIPEGRAAEIRGSIS